MNKNNEYWNFFESSPGSYLAYQLQEGKILINDQVGYSKSGMDVMDEGATDEVCLNADGSFELNANAIQQFNCCNNLWDIVQLINHLTAKLILDKEAILKQDSVFKIHEREYNGIYKDWKYPVDMKFSFTMDSKLYNDNHIQFIKYAFLDEAILSKTWTVASLANFTVHMMKFLYEAEKSGPKRSDNFLNVDSDVQELLEKV